MEQASFFHCSSSRKSEVSKTVLYFGFSGSVAFLVYMGKVIISYYLFFVSCRLAFVGKSISTCMLKSSWLKPSKRPPILGGSPPAKCDPSEAAELSHSADSHVRNRDISMG